LRVTKDKVGKKLARAIERGDLEESSDGRVSFGHVVLWARSKWKGSRLLAMLPAVPDHAEVSSNIAASTWADADIVPANLAACQAAHWRKALK
jgi:hypothetical protein